MMMIWVRVSGSYRIQHLRPSHVHRVRLFSSVVDKLASGSSRVTPDDPDSVHQVSLHLFGHLQVHFYPMKSLKVEYFGRGGTQSYTQVKIVDICINMIS